MSTRNERINARLAHTFSDLIAKASTEKTYFIDAKGRQVRDLTNDHCSPEEIAYFLKGNRVVDEEDILFELGNPTFRYLKNMGYIVQDKTAKFFWVTRKAAENYNLPAIRLKGTYNDSVAVRFHKG